MGNLETGSESDNDDATGSLLPVLDATALAADCQRHQVLDISAQWAAALREW
jgi:hypothetical protein